MMEQDTFCNIIIDYTQLGGDKLLPFQVALDLENSELLPAVGEKQRFCYTVTGIGANLPEAADLSHLVLGVCSRITTQELEAIFVSVDDAEQTVFPGQNVQLLSPDPQTGCCGLKFNFRLNRAGGVMNFCFELNDFYSIGPIPVSLFGDVTSVSGLSICGPVSKGTRTFESAGI